MGTVSVSPSQVVGETILTAFVYHTQDCQALGAASLSEFHN